MPTTSYANEFGIMLQDGKVRGGFSDGKVDSLVRVDDGQVHTAAITWADPSSGLPDDGRSRLYVDGVYQGGISLAGQRPRHQVGASLRNPAAENKYSYSSSTSKLFNGPSAKFGSIRTPSKFLFCAGCRGMRPVDPAPIPEPGAVLLLGGGAFSFLRLSQLSFVDYLTP